MRAREPVHAAGRICRGVTRIVADISVFFVREQQVGGRLRGKILPQEADGGGGVVPALRLGLPRSKGAAMCG